MRLLVVRLGSIGDIVHAMPIVGSMRAAHPDAEVDWVVERALEAVVRLGQGVTRVVPIRTRAVLGAGGWHEALRALRARRYDVALDAQGLVKSAVIARLSGARRVVGWTRRHLREPIAAALYTERVDAGGAVHVIDKNLSLLRALGIDRSRRDVELARWAPSSAAVQEVAVRMGGRYALINAGANWPNKRWPPDRFGEVASRLRREHGLVSLVLWGPGDEQLAEAVVSASSGAATLAPPTSVADVVDLARRAALVVSGDTGPLHLACAAGAPAVGIFGPTDPRRNGPWAPADVSVSRFAACACHHQRACRAADWCLLDIGVDEVMAAAARRLAAAPE